MTVSKLPNSEEYFKLGESVLEDLYTNLKLVAMGYGPLEIGDPKIAKYATYLFPEVKKFYLYWDSLSIRGRVQLRYTLCHVLIWLDMMPDHERWNDLQQDTKKLIAAIDRELNRNTIRDKTDLFRLYRVFGVNLYEAERKFGKRLNHNTQYHTTVVMSLDEVLVQVFRPDNGRLFKHHILTYPFEAVDWFLAVLDLQLEVDKEMRRIGYVK